MPRHSTLVGPCMPLRSPPAWMVGARNRCECSRHSGRRAVRALLAPELHTACSLRTKRVWHALSGFHEFGRLSYRMVHPHFLENDVDAESTEFPSHLMPGESSVGTPSRAPVP